MFGFSSRKQQVFVFILLLLSSCEIHAQLVLVQEHENPRKRSRLFVGNSFEYINQDGIRFRGILESIQDSSIILSGEEVRLANIKSVLYPRPGVRFLSHLAVVGGVFHLGLDLTNALLSRSRPLIGPEVLPIGLAFTASGLLLRNFRFERRKINDKRMLKVLNVSPK